jgi:hypothetical protein
MAAQECDCLWGESLVTVKDVFTNIEEVITLSELYTRLEQEGDYLFL